MRGFAARTLALFLVLLAFGIRNGRAEEQSPPTGSALAIQASSTPQILAGHVYQIFQARCTDCHGANLVRPKGKFGYILDLARVAANPKLILPGKPLQSELYQTVFHDEMPPPKSKRPPLTAEEKEFVKSWIAAGAPASLPPEIATRLAHPLTLGSRIIRDIGQFHPPSTHFPIALLLVALPAEFMWYLSRKNSWKATVRFCVTLGALSAVITAILGWCDAPFSTYAGASATVLSWHRWFGTGTAVWAVLVAALAGFSNRPGSPPRLAVYFRVALVAGAILVSVAGYLGASLIYGLNHFSW